MLKTLVTLRAREAEIAGRKAELTKRRDEIRAAKEEVFGAAAPEDSAAFAKVGELGAQENLVTVQLERLDRELAGLAASLLSEANHVRRAVGRAGIARLDKVLAKLDAALQPFLPDAKPRASIVERARHLCPEVRLLEKRALGTGGYGFNPNHGDEFAYARQVLTMAERAIAECGL